MPAVVEAGAPNAVAVPAGLPNRLVDVDPKTVPPDVPNPVYKYFVVKLLYNQYKKLSYKKKRVKKTLKFVYTKS